MCAPQSTFNAYWRTHPCHRHAYVLSKTLTSKFKFSFIPKVLLSPKSIFFPCASLSQGQLAVPSFGQQQVSCPCQKLPLCSSLMHYISWKIWRSNCQKHDYLFTICDRNISIRLSNHDSYLETCNGGIRGSPLPTHTSSTTNLQWWNQGFTSAHHTSSTRNL